ncbi:MAG: carbohydrate ABC transporter permease [Bacillota bacterium]
MGRRVREGNFILLLLPALLVVVLVYVVPVIDTTVLAFRDMRGEGFVGFDNFRRVGSSFWPSLVRTAIWTFGSVIPAMIIGLVGSLLFVDDFRGKTLLMSLSLLPYCVPLIIVATFWAILYNPSYGLINTFLLGAGLIKQPIEFLSYRMAMPSVILVRVWRATPFAFIAYYAGLKSVPRDILEAADIDGADGIQKFFYVTAPQLRSVTLTTALVLVIWTALVFDIIYAMTGGGPIDATKILPIDIYTQLMCVGDIGVTSAMTLLTVLVLLLFSLVFWKLSHGDEM